MRIVFMGTPDFALPALEYLIDNQEVAAVFTQPDRPKGRGYELAMSPVKIKALDHSIPVYQPEKIKTDEYVNILEGINPDLIVVIAYGQILSKRILDIPANGCINVHASLLPELRGASPINMAIVNGLEETGVATMMMDVGLDTGDVLEVESTKISLGENAGTLHDRLSIMAASVLKRTIDKLEKGELVRVAQDDTRATFAPIIKKEMALIDWDNSAKKIYNHIRGYNPWPVAYTVADGKNMKVFESSISQKQSGHVPGTIVDISNEGIQVSTADFDLFLKEIQMPGSKRMPVKEFIKGNKLQTGMILGGK